MSLSDNFSPSVPVLNDKYVTILICTSGFLGLLFALYQYLKIRKIKVYQNILIDRYHLIDASSVEEQQCYDQSKLITVYEAISEGASAFLAQEFRYMYIFLVVEY